MEFNFSFFFIEFLSYIVQNLRFGTTYKTGSGNGFSLNPTADIFSLILPSFVGDWILDILGAKNCARLNSKEKVCARTKSDKNHTK